MRFAAAILALPLLFGLGAPAAAEDGPARTVGRASELPPRRAATDPAARELVLLVGGLGTEPEDGTWAALAARYRDDPRYEVRRFGSSPAFPYDSTGPIGESAASLTAQVRSLAPQYRAVHLVTHSLGGAVADRAFTEGLSSADGVRTYVALAAPHNGAVAARVASTVVDAAGDEAVELRAALALAAHDPASPAARDMARRPQPAAPSGVARLHVRLATDLLVIDRDAQVEGVDSRLLLPASLGSLEGHGGVLTDPRALDLVTTTIARGAPPPDERGEILRRAAELVSQNAGELALVLLAVAALGALAAAAVLRRARWMRPLTRPVASRALKRRR